MKKSIFLLIVGSIAFFSGCKATYSKDKVPESIINICRKEYQLEVIVKIIGKTVGVYAEINDLLDVALGLSSKATEKLSDILSSISRVTLSTDADLDFFVLYARDPKIKGVQIVVSRYIPDTKRLMTGDISYNEYFQRMDIDIQLNAKTGKEKNNDFPARIEEIKLPNFLAKQIAKRIENNLKSDYNYKKLLKVNSVKGEYVVTMNDVSGQENNFYFMVDIEDKYSLFLGEKKTDPITSIKEVVSLVLRRYEFKDFSKVKINDAKNQRLAEWTPTQIFIKRRWFSGF